MTGSETIEAYNRRAAGKAWWIIGYTYDATAYCTACAERTFTAAALMGEDTACAHCFNPRFSCACGENPAPLFSTDAASFTEGGDHRGGCGLSCDPCGGIIVAACDSCRASIEGACCCPCGCECYAGGFSSCVDCQEGTHQNNNRRAGESRPVA